MSFDAAKTLRPSVEVRDAEVGSLLEQTVQTVMQVTVFYHLT